MVSLYASWHQVVSLHLQWWSSTPDQPKKNYPGMASNPIRAYRPSGRQCRHKADRDFLAFCVLEGTTRTTTDDLDEDGAERPQLPQTVMDQHSHWLPTASKVVGSGPGRLRRSMTGFDSPWELRSFTIFIQVIRGHPGGLFQYTEGEEVKICCASILSSIRAICIKSALAKLYL